MPVSVRGKGGFEKLGNLNTTEVEVTPGRSRLKLHNKSTTVVVFVKDATMGGDETTCDQFFAPGAYEIIDVPGGSAFFYADGDEANHLYLCEVE